jgi:hypothetical protein
MGLIQTDSSGGRKSAARTLLLAILRTSTEKEVARIVGCTQQFVSLCASGKGSPERWKLRWAFWERLRIPPESW